MIRELTAEDLPEATALLTQATEYNLYTLGNLTSVGFTDSALSQFWGDFDEERQLRGILNRYMNGWIVYGNPGADWAGLGQIVDIQKLQTCRLQDNPGGTKTILPFLNSYEVTKVSVQNFMALAQEDFCPAMVRTDIRIQRAQRCDISKLTQFYSNADHMRRSAKGVSRPVSQTRLWFAEYEGEICSAALTNAEAHDVAMIGGVYTPEELRNRGYSYSVCSALCAELLAERKRPILYWETAAAGVVYERLGFHKIGDWRSLHLQQIS